MKKTVKSLIIAASVAAIAGIGAVSFAAWSGGASTIDTGAVSTGKVDSIGFASCTLADGQAELDLMPYNQPTIANSETRLYQVTLKTGAGNYSGKAIYAKVEAVGDSATAPIGVNVTTTAPTAGEGGVLTLGGTQVELTGTAQAVTGKTVIEASTEYTVYIVLVSEADTYAQNSERNFKVVFSLDAQPTT